MRKLGLVFLLCGLLFVIPVITQASLLGSLTGSGLFVQVTGVQGDWWTFTGDVTVDSSMQGIFGTTATFYANGQAFNAMGTWSLTGDTGFTGNTLSGTTSYWDSAGTWMSTFYADAYTFVGPYSMELPSEMYFAGPYWVGPTVPDDEYQAYVTPFYFGPGDISTEKDIVPIPGAVWLLGSGLVGLVGLRRMRTS